MKRYKESQIIKHALQYYISRPGATKKELLQEKSVLRKYEEEVAWMKERYRIRDGGAHSKMLVNVGAKGE